MKTWLDDDLTGLGWKNNTLQAKIKRTFFCRWKHNWHDDYDGWLWMQSRHPGARIGMCRRRKNCWACLERWCPDE